MPIAIVFAFPGEPVAKYHKVFELGGAAVGEQAQRLYHICYRTDDGFTVIDLWEGEQSFTASGSTIGPALGQFRASPKP